MPISEIWFVLYEILLVLIGFGVCLAVVLWLRHHDAEKNHKIFVLEWQKSQLEGRLAALEGKDAQPAPPTTGSNIIPPPPKEVVIRHPRSPVKAENKPVQPLKTDTKKVPPAIPQSDLGRMNAQLKATGAARIIYNGGTRLWN